MKSFKNYLDETHEEGVVSEVIHSIAYVSGLPGASLSEMVLFESGEVGQIMALRPEHIEVLLLTRTSLEVGSRVARTGFPLQLRLSQNLLGQVIDSMGEVIEGKPIEEQDMRPVDVTPLGISARQKITRTLETGVILVDLMVPLGMGQRELILGDRKTGKTHIARQAAVNQARLGNIVVYAMIGKKKSEIKQSIEYFRKSEVFSSMVMIASSSHDAVGQVHVTPYTAMTVAEYFRDSGRDITVILDDMTTHAKFYRELSLLARKFPGRDSYPGDVFHIHSKLVERAGNFTLTREDQTKVEASITCLPIADTVSGDMTGYIQTNLMSMTDGHLLFDGGLYASGRRPAVNPFLSVTRVGHQTQNKLRRDINQRLYDLLNDYERTQSFLRFGAELGENSRQILAMGDKVIAFFNQPANVLIPLPLQIVSLALLMAGSWDGKNMDRGVTAYRNSPEWGKKCEDLMNQNTLQELIDRVRGEAQAWGKLFV